MSDTEIDGDGGDGEALDPIVHAPRPRRPRLARIAPVAPLVVGPLVLFLIIAD